MQDQNVYPILPYTRKFLAGEKFRQFHHCVSLVKSFSANFFVMAGVRTDPPTTSWMMPIAVGEIFSQRKILSYTVQCCHLYVQMYMYVYKFLLSLSMSLYCNYLPEHSLDDKVFLRGCTELLCQSGRRF